MTRARKVAAAAENEKNDKSETQFRTRDVEPLNGFIKRTGLAPSHALATVMLTIAWSSAQAAIM